MTAVSRPRLRRAVPVRRVALLLALLGVAAFVLLVGVPSGDALFLAPVVLLAAILACGRYPGEMVLAALRARAVPTRRHAMSALAPRHVAPLLPRGGRLVAARLAGRAPPVALAAA